MILSTNIKRRNLTLLSFKDETGTVLARDVNTIHGRHL